MVLLRFDGLIGGGTDLIFLLRQLTSGIRHDLCVVGIDFNGIARLWRRSW
jgi:hypothetical protein